MKKTTLVIMAAGMGSRYGGVKQLDPVGPSGEIIMDYSVYDAIEAGFSKVVFIIRKDLEEDFKEVIGNRISQHIEVEYCFQELEDLPGGYSVPEGRTKPWGTGQAILAAKEVVDGPFAVINADDYYGKNAYTLMYDFLANTIDDEKYRYAMVGYTLENTTTEHGHVARGVCEVSDDGYLKDIIERTHIQKRDGKTQYTEDGENWVTLPEGSIVSMNLWGFTPSFLKELEEKFPVFLDRVLKEDP